MRIFSMGVILTLLILVSIVAFRTDNETSTSTETVRIPKLKGALVNNIEEEIIVWGFEADHSEAKAGETVNYSTRVTNPPPGLVGMIVTFISDEEATKIPGSWKY